MLPIINTRIKKALVPYEEIHTEFVAANVILPFGYLSLYTSLTIRRCILIIILYLCIYTYTYIIHTHTYAHVQRTLPSKRQGTAAECTATKATSYY